LIIADSAPQLEGIETDYGLRMFSCRKADAGTIDVRVSNIVMPCHGFIPAGGLQGNARDTRFILSVFKTVLGGRLVGTAIKWLPSDGKRRINT